MKLSHAALLYTLLSIALAGGFLTIRTYETRAAHQAAATLGSTSIDQNRCIDQNVENLPCYETYYDEFAHRHGTAAAFEDLRARYAVSPFVQSQCHQLAHAIGHAASELYLTPSDAFAHGDSFCWSGYYHGVMESLVGESSPESLSETVHTICDDIPGKASYSFDYYNCVHGLGHGIMATLNDELFESLSVCDTLVGSWERTVCTGGVFMENVMAETRTGEAKYLKRDDLLYPCNAVEDAYKNQCFLMQTSHMLAASDYDWSRVFTLCGSVASPYKESCYQSIGRDASGQTTSDAPKTFALCALGETASARTECITGAVKDFVSYFHSDTQAYALCDLLTSKERLQCRSTVAAYYTSF